MLSFIFMFLMRSAKQIQYKAEQAHLSVSKYLAERVKKETSLQWPDAYFEQVFGGWEGDTLQRPSQGGHEKREELG